MSVSSFDTQMLTQIAPENILEWSPCSDYPESRIRAIYGARSSLTPLEVLDLDIPAEDRLWVVLRPEVLHERSLRLIAADIAETVLPLYESQHPGDLRPRTAIETARRYAAGEATVEDLDAARDAAYYATFAAAEPASRSAWSAACAASRSAARRAYYAATKAARAAAGADQWTRVLNIVRGYLTREEIDNAD